MVLSESVDEGGGDDALSPREERDAGGGDSWSGNDAREDDNERRVHPTASLLFFTVSFTRHLHHHHLCLQ
jgi:hypothetical protein